MLEGTSQGDLDSGADFFSMLGGETRKKKQPPQPIDPDKVRDTLVNPLLLAELLGERR